MNNMPVIKLEIEQMRQSIKTALSQYTFNLDESIQAAIDDYFTPYNIEVIIKEEAKKAIDLAVKEEIRDFFKHSEKGRIAIREAVINYLDDQDDHHKNRE